MIMRRGFFGLLAGAFAAAAGWIKPATAVQTWEDTAEKEFGRVKWVRGNYAYRGDVVACENNHPICKFAETVEVGEFFDPRKLTAWQQHEPKIGTMGQPCEICGARWFKGPYFHFFDGWRLAALGDRTVIASLS